VATGVATRNPWAALGGALFGGAAAAFANMQPQAAANAGNALYAGIGAVVTTVATGNPAAALQGLAAAGGTSLGSLIGLNNESCVGGQIFQYATGSLVGGTFSGVMGNLAVGTGALGTVVGVAGAVSGSLTYAGGQLVARKICQWTCSQ